VKESAVPALARVIARQQETIEALETRCAEQHARWVELFEERERLLEEAEDLREQVRAICRTGSS
jgi:phage shock protein A